MRWYVEKGDVLGWTTSWKDLGYSEVSRRSCGESEGVVKVLTEFSEAKKMEARIISRV